MSHMNYIPPVLEIDRTKLRRLNFSQQELAEIGFSLVRQLAVVEGYREGDEGEWYFGRKPPSAA